MEDESQSGPPPLSLAKALAHAERIITDFGSVSVERAAARRDAAMLQVVVDAAKAWKTLYDGAEKARLARESQQQSAPPLSLAELDALDALLIEAGLPANPIHTVKCPCDHPSCETFSLTEGTFYQGAGWDRELAELYAALRNAAPSLLAAARREARRTFEGEQDRLEAEQGRPMQEEE